MNRLQSMILPTVIGRRLRAPSNSAIRRWKGVQLHAFGAALVTASWAIGVSPAMTLLLGGITLTFMFATIGTLETRRSVLWFTPLSFYLFWSTAGLGVCASFVGCTFLMAGES